MRKLIYLLGISSLLVWSTAAYATFDSGSTGVLGNYTATVSKVIQLPDDGVLNYQSINIYPNATITFQKNAKNTPVHMLATCDVNIAGTINLNGSSSTATEPGKGGPGGFDGGYGGGLTMSGGKGKGPGGGNPGLYSGGHGGGGGFANNGVNGLYTNSGTGGPAYGNLQQLPLIGGSGGGGGSGSNGAGGPGGGGGGAILIASSTSITISGSITAYGGNGYYTSYKGGGGSGGAIKLISNIISGNGTISATYGDGPYEAGDGSLGRIRIEANTNNRTAATDPAYSYGLPGNIFVANPPSLTITSVGGATPPANPTGNYNQPDVLLPNTIINPVAVNISAANIPPGTTAKVWVIPQYGTASSVDAILTGTQQSSTATASVTLSTTYSNVVTAEATFTIVGMYYNGEEIDKVRVAATMGGKSEAVYITKSGKEIKGELIAGLVQ